MSEYDPLEGIFQGLSAREQLLGRVGSMEGRWRPSEVARPQLGDLGGGMAFVRIDGLGRFWAEDANQVHAMLLERMQQLLAGIAAASSPCAFVLHGRDRQLEIFLGADSHGLVQALLRSCLPGLALSQASPQALWDDLYELPHCQAIVGDPVPPSEDENVRLPDEQIDRMVRGLLPVCRWAWVVIAYPIPCAFHEELVDRWGEMIEQARLEFQQPNTPQAQDRMAQHYLDLLEHQFKRSLAGRTRGNWIVQAYMISDLPQAGALAVGVLSHPAAGPEPLRAIPCAFQGPVDLTLQSTWLNTNDLSRLIQLPKVEYPGYAVHHTARFDVALTNDRPKKGIQLGWVQDINLPTSQAYQIQTDELVGHTLVAGTTNSGKTNTCFHLLAELAKTDIPFLIIEPSKGEYRYLRYVFPDLQLFTMGSPEEPLEINPFFVPAGVPVQMHVDYLLSLFAASFVLYAPMPYVLEAALHQVYLDKGWDLAANVCRRGQPTNERAFPTLSDLYHQVRRVTERLGYEERITIDVRAALQARINSLRIGSKGAMLDTRAPFDMGALLHGRCVIEMGRVGNDEQKAFLIGLLLMRLYEHYLARGVQVGRVELQHVTVIEEAHRLLQHVSQAQGGDFANPRGKAVETFSNVITEIRGYGEGFVIVEQSPTKLTPDVLKNTNLKIIHRIIAADDQQALARVMNLHQAEQEALVSLPQGRAILFAAGMDRPMLVRFADSKQQAVLDESTSVPSSLPAALLAEYLPSLTEDPGVQLAFARWVMAVASTGGEALAGDAQEPLQAVLRANAPFAIRTAGIEHSLLAATIPRLADWLASRLGQFYGWSFEREEQFCCLLQDSWQDGRHHPTVQSILLSETTVHAPPFDGCQSCRAACRYRLFAELPLFEPSLLKGMHAALDDYFRNPMSEMLWALELYARYVADKVIMAKAPEAPGVALCAAVCGAHRLGLRGPAVIRMAGELATAFGMTQVNSSG